MVNDNFSIYDFVQTDVAPENSGRGSILSVQEILDHEAQAGVNEFLGLRATSAPGNVPPPTPPDASPAPESRHRDNDNQRELVAMMAPSPEWYDCTKGEGKFASYPFKLNESEKMQVHAIFVASITRALDDEKNRLSRLVQLPNQQDAVVLATYDGRIEEVPETPSEVPQG